MLPVEMPRPGAFPDQQPFTQTEKAKKRGLSSAEKQGKKRAPIKTVIAIAGGLLALLIASTVGGLYLRGEPIYIGGKACFCRHLWKEATCTVPRTCLKCKTTQGVALGHDTGEWEKADKNVVGGKEIRKCAACGEIVDERDGDRGDKSSGDLFSSAGLSLTVTEFTDHLIPYLPEDVVICTENEFEDDAWVDDGSMFMIADADMKESGRYVRVRYGDAEFMEDEPDYKLHVEMYFDDAEDVDGILPAIIGAVDSKFVSQDNSIDKIEKISDKIEAKSEKEYAVKLTNSYLLCRYAPEQKAAGATVPGYHIIKFISDEFYDEMNEDKIYVVNTEKFDLRLRKSPSTKAKILADIPKGTRLKVTEQKKGWSKTSYKGKTGWVSSEYLRPLEPGEPEVLPETTEYVVNTEKYDLRLRKGPSTSSAILANIPKGTVLTVTEKKNGWSKTTYRGKTGWVSTAYLIPYGFESSGGSSNYSSSGSSGSSGSYDSYYAAYTLYNVIMPGEWMSLDLDSDLYLTFYSDGTVKMTGSSVTYGTYTCSVVLGEFVIKIRLNGEEYVRVLMNDGNYLCLYLLNNNGKFIPEFVKVRSF